MFALFLYSAFTCSKNILFFKYLHYYSTSLLSPSLARTRRLGPVLMKPLLPKYVL